MIVQTREEIGSKFAEINFLAQITEGAYIIFNTFFLLKKKTRTIIKLQTRTFIKLQNVQQQCFIYIYIHNKNNKINWLCIKLQQSTNAIPSAWFNLEPNPKQNMCVNVCTVGSVSVDIISLRVAKV